MIIGLVICWCTIFFGLRSQPKILTTLFLSGLFLRLMTVIFILCATVGLALCDRLSSEVSTILAGIAGYVLGNSRSDGDIRKPQDTPANTPTDVKPEER